MAFVAPACYDSTMEMSCSCDHDAADDGYYGRGDVDEQDDEYDGQIDHGDEDKSDGDVYLYRPLRVPVAYILDSRQPCSCIALIISPFEAPHETIRE